MPDTEPVTTHPLRPRIANTRVRTSLLLLCLSAAACAAPPRMIQEPRLPTCRGIVDAASAPVDVDVRWFSPASPSDRRTHAEWCGTVGPLVIKPRPRANRPSSPPDAPVAIVSWNTHVGGADLLAFVRDLRGGRWSEGRPAGQFVLLLQEVFRRGADVPAPVGASPPIPDAIRPGARSPGRVDIVDVAERTGLALFYAPSMRNGESGGAHDGEDRGNAILSTLPLDDFRVIELPFERQRRVAVAASVALPGGGDAGPLRVASAHLDALGAPRRLVVLSPVARRRQVRGLVAALPPEEPAVLGADLNTWVSGREGALTDLRRAFPDTPAARGSTYGSLRLDYLFFRLARGWRAAWSVADRAYGSDHRPVVSWLQCFSRASRDCTQSARMSLTLDSALPSVSASAVRSVCLRAPRRWASLQAATEGGLRPRCLRCRWRVC